MDDPARKNGVATQTGMTEAPRHAPSSGTDTVGVRREETETGEVRAAEAAVRCLIGEIFGALGFTAAERAILADTLLEASRAGYSSHGVVRIPIFVEDTRAGFIAPAVAPVVVQETAASVLVDARHCLGPVSTAFAVEQAAAKARRSGVGCAAVRNGNDIACLGSYVGGPARDGLIALLMANNAGGAACVAPFGSATPFLSTNPLAVGVPRESGRQPMVIDFSTSVVALGKVRMAAKRGVAVPEGWLIDRDGHPVTDPTRLLSMPREAALLPLGGATNGHKGFLLSLIVEVLAGALTGAGMSTGSQPDECGNGIFLLVVDPELFGGRRDFVREVEQFIAALEALSTDEAGRVHLPGAQRSGAPDSEVPIDRDTWDRIATILEELSLTKNYSLEPARRGENYRRLLQT